MSQSHVYIVQDMSGRNYLPAKEFGEITIMLGRNDVYRSGFDYEDIKHRLRKKLQDFCPNDYLVLSGDPVAMVLATNIALDLCMGTINVLKWVRDSYKYEEVEININD